MSSPYRSRPGLAPPSAPRDSGIVGDIINQFADRLAFYRELIQNGLDAESTRLDVVLEYDAADGVMRVRVVDDGVGMGREIIEERLLVLFRSTKEDDDTKIGKFGVGFASVLALDPTVVKVTTAKGGERHVVHLFRDLSYELFDTGRSNRSGTTVELEIAMAADRASSFVEESRDALLRWCCHATVPIYFKANVGTAPPQETERIDGPLGLPDALVSVEGQSPDGLTRVVVGVAPDGAYSGFFNHGLMLEESSTPLLPGLSFKVQDSRLGHTLSRDSVRRNNAYNVALDVVKRVAERDLARESARAISEAADGGDIALFCRLVSAVAKAGLSTAHWRVPVLEPIRGRMSVDLDRFESRGGYVAYTSSPVTQHLAAFEVPTLPSGAETVVEDLLRKQLPHALDLTLVMPIEPTAKVSAILDAALDILDDVHRKPTALIAAEFEGASYGEPVIACPSSIKSSPASRAEDFLVPPDQTARNPFAFFRRCGFAINVGAPPVRELLALDDIRLAASLLARTLLQTADALDQQRSEELLDLDLEQCGFSR